MSNDDPVMARFVSEGAASEPERFRPTPEFIREVARLVTAELAAQARPAEAEAERKRQEAWERYVDWATDGEGFSEEGLKAAHRELEALG